MTDESSISVEESDSKHKHTHTYAQTHKIKKTQNFDGKRARGRYTGVDEEMSKLILENNRVFR